MPTIDLNRQFREWREGEKGDPSLWRLLGSALNWDDLLARRRVVILAEGGSGKTSELRAQAQIAAGAGRFAVYATVEDVGRDGLEQALSQSDRQHLTQWRSSDSDGWFFLDSVDEAKRNSVRFEKALRRIAEAIIGAERRAHIILSGRYTEWESRHDFSSLMTQLPVPPAQSALASPSPDELLINIIRQKQPKAQEPGETPLVTLMLPLDAERVRSFAIGKGISDVDVLVQNIESGDWWQMAGRPLDLEWIVSFWRREGRLGTLREMLETSLSERLKEPAPSVARTDSLDSSRALQALERIGAALAFSRTDTIRIPDSELAAEADSAGADLAEILPDWSSADRIALLSRPVFEPGPLGRVRLHNDNTGVVRSFLASRWLTRLGSHNLPIERLSDLLFATTYQLDLIRPSLQQVAAWNSISDQDVAREVIRRSPFLLLSHGDPQSLSLATRTLVLKGVVESIGSEDDGRSPIFDLEALGRFAQADLAPVIRDAWSKFPSHAGVRNLLLQLIGLGAIKSCGDLSASAVFDWGGDEVSQILAGRALMAAADDAAKRRYAQAIKGNCKTWRTMVTWDGIDGLFPDFLSIDDLLAILAEVDPTDDASGMGLETKGPELVERIQSCGDVEKLLAGLLQQLGGETGKLGYPPDKREEAFFPAINAAACRILDFVPNTEAPDLAIDAALRLRERHHQRRRRGVKSSSVSARLHCTTERRRAAFWRAAHRFSGNPTLQGRAITSPWEMDTLGYSPGLRIEDIDWLLADAPERPEANDRRLAISAALLIWRSNGESESVGARIEAVARQDETTSAAFDGLTRAPERTADQIRQEREFEEMARQNAAQLAARDQSWIDFFNELRRDPAQLRNLRPSTPDGADSRLFHLWQLLYEAHSSHTRYSIESLSPLEPILGPALTAAFREGLAAHWRQWRPTLDSEKEPTRRNQVGSLDCMGLAGLSLESQSNPRWAASLDLGQAQRAATYALIEINGFPTWLPDLVAAAPGAVEGVFMAEVRAELAERSTRTRFEVLEHVSRAGPELSVLLSDPLLAELTQHSDLPLAALRPLLEILGRGALRPEQTNALTQLAAARFAAQTDTSVAAQYLSALFATDPTAATAAFLTRLEQLPDVTAKTELAKQVLPQVFGGDFSPRTLNLKDLPFECLDQLVRVAYETIRTEEDHNRVGGGVYSPDQRDHAESARSTAFRLLVDTPGQATFDALNRLAQSGTFPVPARRLKELAIQRAYADSESAAWPLSEPHAYEQSFETAPRTAKDLLDVVLSRLRDTQHDLLHADFAQGGTVQTLADETAVQNWMADRMRLKQGRSYSVEREPHVVGEKEPDIRCRAKATDASVPIEIKVAESWSFEQLEAALITQLCGRYLRARDGRHGILLLVHQHARPRGWKAPDTGEFVEFGGVVERLKAKAVEISGAAPDAPQPVVAVIDVSTWTAP